MSAECRVILEEPSDGEDEEGPSHLAAVVRNHEIETATIVAPADGDRPEE